jgi:bacillopeptidase F
VAKNSCGSAASTSTVSFTTAAGVVTLLSEGAESGATGWTYVKNTGSGWSNETSTDSHSGSHRFRTNAAYPDYINGADWSVVSPAFSLVGKTTATLTYYCKFSTESGYDYFSVEVSKDGGTTWTSLRKSSGNSGSYPAWAAQGTISLSPYVGSANTKIRFRLTTDGSVTGWGAAVDDIVVTAQ